MADQYATGKICVICGKDCSAIPRTKDQQGRYYCRSCYEAAMERRRKQTLQPAAVPPPVIASGQGEDGGDVLADVLVGAADASKRGCPNCGVTAMADAVLCTNCGFNFNTGQNLQTANWQPPTPSAEPGRVWPIVIGVISITFGGAGTLINGFSLYDALTGGIVSEIVGAAVAFTLSVWLLSAGIGIVRRRSAAVASIRAWAITKLALAIVCLGGVGLLTLALSGSEFTQAVSESAEIPAELLAGILFGVMLWFSVWPIFLLIWFSRSTIKSHVNTWR